MCHKEIDGRGLASIEDCVDAENQTLVEYTYESKESQESSQNETKKK